MNKILVLLIFSFMPIGVTAQQSLPDNTHSGENSLSRSEIKPDKQSQNNTQIWLNVGVGVGTPQTFSGIAGITYQFGRNLLTLRVSTVGEPIDDNFSDIGLLYGRATSTDSFHFSIAAGLALVSVIRSEGLFASDEVSNIGIPLELQANWEPTNFIGLGITGFANINPEQSFAGITIAIQIGKLR